MITKLRRNFILVAMCSMAAVLAVIVGTLNLVSYLNMVSKADTILELLAENDAAFPDMPQKPEGDMAPPQEEMLPTEGNAMVAADENAGESSEVGDFVEGDSELQAPPDIVENSAGSMLEPKEDPAGNMTGQKEDPGKHRTSLHLQEMSPETPYETRYFSVKLNTKGQVTMVDTGKIAAVETEDAIDFAEEIWESGKTSGFYDTYRYKVVVDQDSIMILFVDRSRELASFQTLAVSSISMSILGLFAVYVLVLIFSKRVFRPVAASYEKQKQFITDASHELKTPLTIISANVEVLEMELADMEMVKRKMPDAEIPDMEMQTENTWIKSIQNQITRLTTLVNQMVTLSRMDERNELQEASDFAISGAVQETAELFRTAAEGRGITLEVSVDGEYSYHGDEGLIRQMVSLLVDNAVKYASENGQIKVSLVPKGKRFQLTVWNTTEEIPQGNLDILFERFYRLDSSRNSKTGGSGIGLSIVKSIVEAHRGKISARSEDGRSLQIVAVL